MSKIVLVATKFVEWCNSNGLDVNYLKTKYMVIRKPQRKIAVFPTLLIDTHNIERVTSFKYLGVVIDEHFSFKDHAELVNSRVSATCGIIRKIRRFLNLHVFKLLINAYVFSIIDYCLIIWGQSQFSILSCIDRQVKRLLICFLYPQSSKFYSRSYWKANFDPITKDTPAKTCFKFFKNIDYSNLLQKVNALGVLERVNYYACVFIYKSLVCGSKVKEIHEWYAEERESIKGEGRVSNSCSKLWNE